MAGIALMPMYPCNRCLDKNWKFEKPDRETVRATCQGCGYEVEFTPQGQEETGAIRQAAKAQAGAYALRSATVHIRPYTDWGWLAAMVNDFIIFPPFGHPEACKDYDEDCFEMTETETFNCCFSVKRWHDGKMSATEARDGICPFHAD